MSVLGFLRPIMITHVLENCLLVVHPLDHNPEQKVDTSTLGSMPMTTAGKISRMALRGYPVMMMVLVVYQGMDLAGAFGEHGRR